MEFDKYQSLVAKMPLYDDPILGLMGEVGEVVELIKKDRRDDLYFRKPLDKGEFILEAGDVLWYLARLAHEHDVSLDEIAQANIRKLDKRHADARR